MMKSLVLVSAAVAVLAAAPVRAQSAADAEWKALVEKAKGQSLVLNNQGNQAIDTVLEAFTKKFGIKVEPTVSRPSQAITRIQTEQKNGQYLWDVWWAITANMVSVASPAGMFDSFEKYLVLPEVKDASQWRHPDYMYGDSRRNVFTYSHEVSYSIYRNSDNVPEVKGDSIDVLMDPRLKGKLVLRDASVPNAGSFALATIYQVKGAEYLKKLLKDQEVKVFDNPQGLDTAIIRGGAAVALGVQGFSFSQCKIDGGCKKIDEMKSMKNAVSRGFAVFKNAPHPEATKVFLNWALSKEGQTLLVQEWAKYNTTGAVSLRKDVAPHPDQVGDLPDFSKPDQYVWVSMEKGNDEVEAVSKIFKDYIEK
jgi:ABC-type Fe3+ transport system substrate-binding protein